MKEDNIQGCSAYHDCQDALFRKTSVHVRKPKTISKDATTSLVSSSTENAVWTGVAVFVGRRLALMCGLVLFAVATNLRKGLEHTNKRREKLNPPDSVAPHQGPGTIGLLRPSTENLDLRSACAGSSRSSQSLG